jgi:hypothetical protein
MADVAKQMYLGRPGTTDTLLYTAPAAGAIVRSVHIANETGTAATITLAIKAGGALAAGTHFLSAFSVPANGTYDWSGFKALGNVETIRALQGTTNALTVSVDGVEQ